VVINSLDRGTCTRKEARAIKEEIVRAVDPLPKRIGRELQKGGTLSVNEQQMLAIASALATRSRAPFLDRPHIGLSPVLVEALFQSIQDTHVQRITILPVEQLSPSPSPSTGRAGVGASLSVASRGYVLQTAKSVLQDTATTLQENEMFREVYHWGS
jgi:branched-chain amino acid transport system ATP-binding protein